PWILDCVENCIIALDAAAGWRRSPTDKTRVVNSITNATPNQWRFIGEGFCFTEAARVADLASPISRKLPAFPLPLIKIDLILSMNMMSSNFTLIVNRCRRATDHLRFR